jgi:WhiB family redox-sensing transcriptional regulator
MKYPDFTNAPCKEIGVDFFYPEEDTSDTIYAKKICGTCPLIDQCLEWGLHHELHGIWGGTTPNTRDKMRVARKIRLKSILVESYL